MSIVGSLRGSLPRSLVGSGASAGFPWEDAGGGTSQTALLTSLLSGVGGLWWDARQLAAAPSTWVDRLTGFSMAFAGGISVANGVVTFNGTTGLATSASNPLNGKSAYTVDIVGSMPAWAAATPVLWASGTDAGGAPRVLLYANGASGLQDFLEAPGGTTNNWSSGATAMADGVYTFQGDTGAGAAATTDVLKNGTTLGGSRTASGVASGNFATGNGLHFASQSGGGSLFANLSAHAIVMVPTVTNAQNAQRIALLRGIYGV